MTVSHFAAMALTVLVISGSAYTAFSIFCVLEFFGRRKGKKKDSSLPGVSVLKPVKDIDPELRENIGSFCQQYFPAHEVLVGVMESGEEISAVRGELAGICPVGTIHIVAGRKNLGANRKVSNLQSLLDKARYPLLAISDSDMRVGPDYLSRIVGEYCEGENVGMVTSLYMIPSPCTVGAALESLAIAVDFIPSVLVARRLEGVTFGLGASMLLSKKAIEEIGGLRAVADYLADDYQIGNRLWKRGYTVILSDYVIEDVVGKMSVVDHLVHQVRWARTYRASRPRGFLGYGVTHIFTYSLILALLEPSKMTLGLFGLALLSRAGIGVAVARKVIKSGRWLKWLLLLPLRDILGFAVWLRSLFGGKVFWRGKYYKVLRDGKLEEYQS